MFKTADMLNVFQKYRGDAIVVPGRGGRHWIHISRREKLDVPLGDPAMGGHAGFAFGLAMALPHRKVAISLALASAGASIAINTRSSREQAYAVANRILDSGGAAEVYVADIADGAAVKRLAESALDRFGRIDILVLNASIRKEVLFRDMTFEDWRQVMSISLDGSFHCVKACLPSMIENGGGNVVTLAGDTALLGAVKKVHSSAAKAGLVGMTRALSRELAEYGIRVNCVSPGLIETTRPAHRSARADPKGLIPLGRWGQSDEIAAAVRFLCGPGGGFITGQTLHVNGGQMIFA